MSDAIFTRHWTYEFNAASDPTQRRAIRSVENRVDWPEAARTVSMYPYTNGDEARRDKVFETGTRIDAMARQGGFEA